MISFLRRQDWMRAVWTYPPLKSLHLMTPEEQEIMMGSARRRLTMLDRLLTTSPHRRTAYRRRVAVAVRVRTVFLQCLFGRGGGAAIDDHSPCCERAHYVLQLSVMHGFGV